VLEQLLVLDGERLSYRTLDVEEIGSVYQAVMGFRIERRSGRALVLRSKATTAPVSSSISMRCARSSHRNGRSTSTNWKSQR